MTVPLLLSDHLMAFGYTTFTLSNPTSNRFTNGITIGIKIMPASDPRNIANSVTKFINATPIRPISDPMMLIRNLIIW